MNEIWGAWGAGGGGGDLIVGILRYTRFWRKVVGRSP